MIMNELSVLEEIDGTFYMEDKILVRTVYFENVPIKEGDSVFLSGFFSQYGHIENLTIEKKYKTYQEEVKVSGTVEYKDAESAYRAIKDVSRKNFYLITYADSWKQPQIEGQSSQLVSQGVENSYFNQLNDDCLLHIISFLRLKDQIQLVSIYKDLKPILKTLYKSGRIIKISICHEADELSVARLRKFFMDYGDAIEKFELLDGCSNIKSVRYFNFVLHFCTNLKYLHISSIQFKNKDFSQRIAKFKNVKLLKMTDCRLSDEDIINLSTLENVEILDLSGDNNSFVGVNLDKFKNLKELYLSGCEDLNEEHFSKICKNFDNLKILDVHGCPNILVAGFKVLSEYAKNLETLIISIYKNNMDNIGRYIGALYLKKLTIINSNRRGCVDSCIPTPNLVGLLRGLTQSSNLKNSLISLKLPYCKLEEDDFLEIANLKQLKKLLFAISMEVIPLRFWSAFVYLKKLNTLCIRLESHYSLPYDFIIKLIQCVSERNQENIFTLRTDISRENTNKVLQDPVYLENRQIFELSPYYLTDSTSYHALSRCDHDEFITLINQNN